MGNFMVTNQDRSSTRKARIITTHVSLGESKMPFSFKVKGPDLDPTPKNKNKLKLGLESGILLKF